MLRLVAVCLLGLAGAAEAATYHLYFLGGQSNMEGYGLVSELPDDLAGPVDGVMIFNGRLADDDDPAGGQGTWQVLEPGHGLGFLTDGTAAELGSRFGPELTFGRRLAERAPDKRVAIIKYAKGGSGLGTDVGYGDWDPDYAERSRLNQYDHALTTIRNALSEADIDGDGEPDTLVPAGIVWMQGESDAGEPDVAAAYQANLERMMNLLRAALRVDDLPVVIGKITNSGMWGDTPMMEYIDVVQRAQAAFVEADECAAYVTVTDEFSYPPDDPWHYTTDGFIRLGAAFAEAALALQESCKVVAD
jgi:hypothetical protein